MSQLVNLDLFSVGIAIASIGILGFAVFFNNSRSITNRTFLLFSLIAIAWSISNYLIYQFETPEIVLRITRIHMFFSVWYSFFIFDLFLVFPNDTKKYTKLYKFFLIPLVILTAILTITPFVLSQITQTTSRGEVALIAPGPGILVFAAVVIGLIGSGIVSLIRKMLKSEEATKIQFKLILTGAAVTFLLHLIFNFALPIIFKNPNFVRFGSVYAFPFIALTSYAIFKHHLFNTKILATEALTFILSIVTLYEVVVSDNTLLQILRFGVFCLVLAFSILLIRSVRREVEQRERLQVLTGQLTVAKLELEKANARLRELDQLKSEFLGFAAHQVRSPMVNVKGFASLILDGSYGEVPKEVGDAAQKIKDSADRLIALVNNLLDLRKIEEGKMEFQFTEVDIIKLVSGMAEEYRVGASAKNLNISFKGPSGPIKIKADAEKLRQVIQNLIDNAIKYTKEGSVTVAVKDEPDYVTVSVSDTGPGMSEELIGKLFQRFVRDEKTKREIQGTGLGLYIAKQIVDAHRGKIWAESKGEGKGSTFYVKLGRV